MFFCQMTPQTSLEDAIEPCLNVGQNSYKVRIPSMIPSQKYVAWIGRSSKDRQKIFIRFATFCV